MIKCDDWSRLVGLRVELRRGTKRIRVGTVQHAMADSSALWLAAEGVERRMLVPSGENYEIWVDAECEENAAFRRPPEPVIRYRGIWTGAEVASVVVVP